MSTDRVTERSSSVKTIFDTFIFGIYSTVGLILKEIHTNQELLVVFHVLYSIYGELQEDEEKLNQWNPNALFARTLHDFRDIYFEIFKEQLPLFPRFQEILTQEDFLELNFSFNPAYQVIWQASSPVSPNGWARMLPGASEDLIAVMSNVIISALRKTGSISEICDRK